MKIKKLGHCCFIAEINGKRIMTDPGSYTINEQVMERNIDLIIITHEHQDHLHIESLHKILENNPNAIIITNEAVGNLIVLAGISFIKVEQGESHDFQGIAIRGFGNTHAEIYNTIGQVQNTGYMIDSLCYPGDSFHHPGSEVDVLALPVAGPWMKIKEAIEYAKEIKPRVCFPVHDWNMKMPGVVHRTPGLVLAEQNIQFRIIEDGKEEEL